MSPMPGVTDTVAQLGVVAIVVTWFLLIFGVPVLIVLAIRALWYRSVYIGRSAELDKLVWQLHRIASALESRAAILPKDGQPTASPEPLPVIMSMFGR